MTVPLPTIGMSAWGDDVNAALTYLDDATIALGLIAQTSVVTSVGNASTTLAVGSSTGLQLFSTTLTANRTVTLDSTGAANGTTFVIVRTAGGSFTLDVGGLVNLYQNQWCVVTWTGSAWLLRSFGQVGQNAKLDRLAVTEGSNAVMGLVTLSGATTTVNTTAVTANSRIFLTAQSTGGTPGFLRVSGRVAGTSFTITSSTGSSDTSTVAWLIVEPN